MYDTLSFNECRLSGGNTQVVGTLKPYLMQKNLNFYTQKWRDTKNRVCERSHPSYLVEFPLPHFYVRPFLSFLT